MIGLQHSHPPLRQSDPQEASKQHAIFAGELWFLLHLPHSTGDKLMVGEKTYEIRYVQCHGEVGFLFRK